MTNDCNKCLARNDGTYASYCYHVAFEHSHPGGLGRMLPEHNKNPAWCPGMVREEASGLRE